jgi:tetratricopeptide (TPR) repeat protein
VPVQPEGSGPYGWAICTTCVGLMAMGEIELAESLVDRTERTERDTSEDDPVFVACLRVARAYLQLFSGSLATALANLVAVRTLVDGIGHGMGGAMSRCLLVAAYAETGSYDHTAAAARDLHSVREAENLRFLLDRSSAFLGRATLEAGRVHEAIALLEPLLGRPDPQVVASARSCLARALVAAGDLDSAEREARATLDQGARFPSTHPAAFCALALVAMRRGALSDALAFAERGLAVGSRGVWLRDGSILRLARAETLHALGQIGDARDAIREARDRILRIASTLDDPELGRSYVTNITANARTLELASAWLDREST